MTAITVGLAIFLFFQFLLVLIVLNTYLPKAAKNKWEPRLTKVNDNWRWGPYNTGTEQWYKSDNNIPTWDNAGACGGYCALLNRG